MSTLKPELEDDLAALLQSLNQPLERAVREILVLELYRRGSISSGKAAELLGLPRADFIRHASSLGIAYLALTEDEWKAERAGSDSL
jgi:predicted HTH domain antitoxin